MYNVKGTLCKYINLFWESEHKMISDSEKSRLQVGFKQVLRALNEKKAERVILSSDCDDSICSRIESLCKESGIPVAMAKSMRELGTICGIEVKASCAVILK